MDDSRRKIPVVAVVSPKGGVGKTTLTVNLAAALTAEHRTPLIVDLDAQNGARLHHGIPLDDSRGLAVQTLRGEAWDSAVFAGAYGVNCLPYGTLSEPDRRALEDHVGNTPTWLRDGLASLPSDIGDLILLDTPPGGSVFLRQALACADVVLTVMLPDAASFVTVPTMERWLAEYGDERRLDQSSFYVVNRMNESRALSRDVLAALKQQLRDRLAPQVVRFDAAVEEALACQRPLAHYAPDSGATKDIAALAHWLAERT